MGIEIHEKNPTIEDFERIAGYVENYEDAYKTDRLNKRKGRENLDISRPESKSSEHRALIQKFEKLEKEEKCLNELDATRLLVERIGEYPKLFDYENNGKDAKEKFKKEEDSYENKYADKKTRNLIKMAIMREGLKAKNTIQAIKQTKCKHSFSVLTEDIMYGAYVFELVKEKFYHSLETITITEYENKKNALLEKMRAFNPNSKFSKIFDKYDRSVDEDTHDSRIEKAMSLSDKDEKTLESIFDIAVPSDIREEFTERDLKVFDAYSKKMRESIEKVKEFDIEMAEYQLAEERSETALDELTQMHSIPDKMKAKIRNSIKAHETKLSKSKRKLKEKQEKYEEKTGIKNELGRVGHYKKLLELHQKYAGVTITEEKLLAEADCSIRIDEAKKELEEMKRKAPSEERDQEIEKIESKISLDKARLKEFKEVREGVAEYKGMMKDFVEDTIARARGKDKITTKALPAVNVEAKEIESRQEAKQEEKPNYQVLRDSIANSRTRYPNAPKKEEKTNNDVKNKDNDKDSKSDIGEIE